MPVISIADNAMHVRSIGMTVPRQLLSFYCAGLAKVASIDCDVSLAGHFRQSFTYDYIAVNSLSGLNDTRDGVKKF